MLQTTDICQSLKYSLSTRILLKRKLNKMKTFRIIFSTVLAVTLCLGISSCSNDDEGSLTEAPYEPISGKYSVTNSSVYESIELGASGTYIITKATSSAYSSKSRKSLKKHSILNKAFKIRAKDSYSTDEETNVIYGDFVKIGENTFTLEGFGTLQVDYTGNNISNFKITPTGDSTLSLNVEKEAVYESNIPTDQLCRTWNFISMHDIDYKDGEKVYDNIIHAGDTIFVDENGEEDHGYTPKQVLFSKSGTYLVSYYGNESLFVAEWKWNDLSKQTIYYRELGDSWSNDNVCTINFSGNKMIITEIYEESNDEGNKFKYESTTILSAVN